MKRLFFVLFLVLLIPVLAGCGERAGETAVPAPQGPALLFFYTDN